MKKLFVVFFTILLLSSCFGKEEGENVISKKGLENNKEIISYEGIDIDVSQDNLDKQREKILLDDLDRMYAGVDSKKDNKLLEVGKKFISNINTKQEKTISENIEGGINLKDFKNEIGKVPKKLKRKISLNLDIVDGITGKAIDRGRIYVNNINMGMFINGKFKREIDWPIGIEKFHIVARSDNYGDGFKVLNSINSEGSLLLGKIYLQKSEIIKDFDLSKERKIKLNGFDINFDKCSFVYENGKCFDSKVNVKANFIKGDDVNSSKFTLNMNALRKDGQINHLVSGGMNFIDFTTNDGKILKIDEGKSVKLTYNVTDIDIKTMKYMVEKGGKEDYWYYDKVKGIWIETDANYSLDEKNKTWTVIIKNL